MINCPTCVFADFDSDKCKRLLIRLPHICPYSEERKPRNNFEMVKNMSMEQMADTLAHKADACRNCIAGSLEICKECWLEWLKEER